MREAGQGSKSAELARAGELRGGLRWWASVCARVGEWWWVGGERRSFSLQSSHPDSYGSNGQGREATS